MLSIPQELQTALGSIAYPEAVVRAPQVRFTVLTSRLIRMEYSPQDVFEDRPSQAFWYRRQSVPEIEVHQSPNQIEITTEHLTLRYTISVKGFNRRSLSIEQRESGRVWHHGDRDAGNLWGTARTLDDADGPVKLKRGLMSRSGWSVVDDSDGLVFNEQGWLEQRMAAGNADLYFFGYGHDYLGCLRDFCQVSGPMPLIPRWALGNWWSRYWDYSQAELTQLMQDFQTYGVPLSVCVIDMDWHITDTGNTCSGWTGYTWNRQLFPDPEGLVKWLHEQGLKVTLNLHPAEGVHPHEQQYPAMAQRMGLDPVSAEPVSFDIANPRFAAAYLEILHHPYEAQGIDFWWLDWQQGEKSRLSGLDPLWWLNHLHFYDLGREGHKRPFIFSRWGGLGSRYAVGFSGDTIVSWKSLAFQPFLTATAANVAFGWWSHDIGGHQRGIQDAELYTRWVQWGSLSPIMRLHSTKNPYLERRPWGYDAETLRIVREAMQLRHALIPYLYSMARRCFIESRPLVLPMYYLYPQHDDAYKCPNQYILGSELIAAPYVSPRDPDTQLSRQAIWLPEGDWFNFFTGEHYTGGGWRTLYGTLDDIPLLAKAGGIIPIGPKVGWGGIANPAELYLTIFPGADNQFELYEDDGETQAYRDGHYCVTRFSQSWQTNRLQFAIAPVQGDLSCIPAQRTYRLILRGIKRPDEVHASVNSAEAEPSYTYDDLAETLTVQGVALAPKDTLTITLATRSGTLLSKRDRRLETCRKLLRAFRLDADAQYRLDRDLANLLEGKSSLLSHSRDLQDAHLSALSNVIQQR